jgi:hypothetical protein
MDAKLTLRLTAPARIVRRAAPAIRVLKSLPWRLVVACAALVAVSCAPSAAPSAAPPPPNCDRPFGRIPADHLPIASALPPDLRQDEQERPYHLLIRTFAFPAGTPLDVEIDSVRVLGQPSGRRVAPGEYLFEQLPSAVANCGVYRMRPLPDSPSGMPIQSAGPRERPEPITMRAPLTLARHCTVVCDLHLATDLASARPFELRGFVVDREDGKGLADATVKLRVTGKTITTSLDGSFRFDEPVTWEQVLAGISVECAGHFSAGLTERALLSLWVDRFRRDGIAAFALMPDRRGQPTRTTIPPLRN